MVFVAAAILVYRLQYKTYGKKHLFRNIRLLQEQELDFWLIRDEIYISKDLYSSLK